MGVLFGRNKSKVVQESITGNVYLEPGERLIYTPPVPFDCDRANAVYRDLRLSARTAFDRGIGSVSDDGSVISLTIHYFENCKEALEIAKGYVVEVDTDAMIEGMRGDQ